MSGSPKKKKAKEDEEVEREQQEVVKPEGQIVVDNLSLGDKVNDVDGTVGCLSLNQAVFNIYGGVHDGNLGNNELSGVRDIETKKLVQSTLKDEALEATVGKNWIEERVTFYCDVSKRLVPATVVGAFTNDKGEIMWRLLFDNGNGKTIAMNESELQSVFMKNSKAEIPRRSIFREPGTNRNRSNRKRKYFKKFK